MKKAIIIGSILVVVAILFVPVPGTSYDDGGTREFNALTYKIVKWNKIYDNDLCYNSIRFYFGADKNKSIDELWEEINPVTQAEDNGSCGEEINEFTATVLEINESSVLVEPLEGCWERNSSDKIVILKAFGDSTASKTFSDIAVGDKINISYYGSIAETYPARIDTVFEVTPVPKPAETTQAITRSVTTEKYTEIKKTTTQKPTAYTNNQTTTEMTTSIEVTPPPKTVKQIVIDEDEVITGVFIVKEATGCNLILSKYDRDAGELKEGLYACYVGDLDGSADMNVQVGDVLTVRYNKTIAETYPYQITVREIYPAEWN